jgi:dipeptidyl aminopeptidase/acylaminoacyl peptidase
MSNLLLEREIIELNQAQTKMLISGWGEEAINNSTVEKITYLSEGLKIKGYLAKPKHNGEEKNKFPCIIWNRGGFENSGAIDTFTACGIFGEIASWGYVVFASQYRGNAGSEGKDMFGGEDVTDVLNLIPLADEIPEADTNLWGIEGWSRGGMMTYLALTKNHNFKCAVVSGGIANLRCSEEENTFLRDLYKAGSGEYKSAEFIKECEERSIINFTEKLSKNTPILLLHGTADKRVPTSDSLELSYKLLENNIPFRLLLLEGGDHFLKSHKREVSEMRRNWFKRFLV